LNLAYTFNPWIWLTGLLTGSVGVTLAGLIGTRSALSTPPLMTLRKVWGIHSAFSGMIFSC